MQRMVFAAAFACVMLAHSETLAQTATQDINISATVAGVCTINGLATGSPTGSAVIPTPSGNVDVTPITPTGSPFANVVCNGPSNLRLTSLNGGVLNSSSAAGFDHIINYTAAASWNSATATINTSTNPAASVGGNELGSQVTVGTAGSGSLTVTITPIANAQPLIAGSYSDTLRITLTPQ